MCNLSLLNHNCSKMRQLNLHYSKCSAMIERILLLFSILSSPPKSHSTQSWQPPTTSSFEEGEWGKERQNRKQPPILQAISHIFTCSKEEGGLQEGNKRKLHKELSHPVNGCVLMVAVSGSFSFVVLAGGAREGRATIAQWLVLFPVSLVGVDVGSLSLTKEYLQHVICLFRGVCDCFSAFCSISCMPCPS